MLSPRVLCLIKNCSKKLCPFLLTGALLSCTTLLPQIPICGNGTVEVGEICDDGNTVGGDGCRADCFGAEECGDQIFDFEEVCLLDSQDVLMPVAPQFLTSVDVNGDGALDLITSNEKSGDIAIFFGNAQGDFPIQLMVNVLAQAPFATGLSSVAVADFDGDKSIDLAVGDTDSDSLLVFLQKEKNRFELTQSLSVGKVPDDVLVADLDNDQLLDLVTSNEESNNLSILFNEGDGVFAPPVFIENTGVTPNGIVIDDVNGDSLSDIVVAATGSSEIILLLNEGQRNFQDIVSFSVEGFPVGVTIGDVSGDSILDIVASVEGAIAGDPGTIALFFGQGNGQFDPQTPIETNILKPATVVLGDAIGNSLLDIVVADNNGTSINFLENLGAGTFLQARSFFVGQDPEGLALVDISSDGLPDIITANEDTSDLSVLLNQGGGNFNTAKTVSMAFNPKDLVTGDMNGDGITDLISAQSNSKNVFITFGLADGTFGDKVAIDVEEEANAIAIGDLDADADLDLVTTSAVDDSVRLLINDSTGLFFEDTLLVGGQEPVSVVLGDINQDGRQDGVTANQASNDISIFFQEANKDTVLVNIPTGGVTPGQVLLADLNNDTFLDIIVSNIDSDTISIFLTDGENNVPAPILISVGNTPKFMAIGELTGDENLDIVTANFDSKDLSILQGDGTGNFVVATTILPNDSVNTFLGPIQLGDIDQDKDLDIFFVEESTAQIRFLLNNGALSFTESEEVFQLENIPSKIVLEDFSGDGVLDLASTLNNERLINVILSTP